MAMVFRRNFISSPQPISLTNHTFRPKIEKNFKPARVSTIYHTFLAAALNFRFLCAAVLGEDDAEDGDEDAEPLEEGEVLAADDFGDEGGGYAHHGEEDAGLAHA